MSRIAEHAENLLPPLPSAQARGVHLVIRDAQGNARELPAGAALEVLAKTPHLICHAAYVIDRLGFAGGASRAAIRQAREVRHFDVAELFAFAAPAVAAPGAAGASPVPLEVPSAATALATPRARRLARTPGCRPCPCRGSSRITAPISA